MLFPGLTKLVPKYPGEYGQQSVVACKLCFNILLCLFRPQLYPAKSVDIIICGAQICDGDRLV